MHRFHSPPGSNSPADRAGLTVRAPFDAEMSSQDSKGDGPLEATDRLNPPNHGINPRGLRRFSRSIAVCQAAGRCLAIRCSELNAER